MHDHLRILRRAYPLQVRGSSFAEDFPLFPNSEGEVCTKDAMAATFKAAARHLDLPESSPDGLETMSGHTLRVTGAQGLSRLGLDLWAIQLFGRWGSEAVNGYVRLVPLEQAARVAAGGCSFQGPG